jgi:hypothetical protein
MVHFSGGGGLAVPQLTYQLPATWRALRCVLLERLRLTRCPLIVFLVPLSPPPVLALSNPCITDSAVLLFPSGLLVATLGALSQTGTRLSMLSLLAGQGLSPSASAAAAASSSTLWLARCGRACGCTASASSRRALVSTAAARGRCQAVRLLKDSFNQYFARWGSADRNAIDNVEYSRQMGLWDSKVQSTLTAAVVL